MHRFFVRKLFSYVVLSSCIAHSAARRVRNVNIRHLVNRSTDLGVVGNRVEDIGQEPCLVVVPARSKVEQQGNLVRSPIAKASAPRAGSLVPGTFYVCCASWVPVRKGSKPVTQHRGCLRSHRYASICCQLVEQRAARSV